MIAEVSIVTRVNPIPIGPKRGRWVWPTGLTSCLPGDYILIESFAPAEYVRATEVAVIVNGGQDLPVTVKNAKG